MAWYVDKGLATLIRQIKDRYPGIVIGTIGDTAHQNRKSDHNPESDGSEDAADFMIGKHFTKNDAEWLFDTLYRHRDPRIAFVRYNNRIYSSTVSPWEIRHLAGHTDHLHLSVNDKHENDTRLWRLGGLMHKMESLTGYALPILKYGENDRDFDGYWSITRAQRLLQVTDDGDYGPKTATAVAELIGGNGKIIDQRVWIKLAGLTVAKYTAS